MLQFFVAVYIVFVAITSMIAFVLYGWDKRQARRNRRRIPEQTLHLLALLGGWPGAMAGQRYFRHKTQKSSFWWMTNFAMMLHLAITVILIVSWFRQ